MILLIKQVGIKRFADDESNVGWLDIPQSSIAKFLSE